MRDRTNVCDAYRELGELSTSEIASRVGVSRQAVHQALTGQHGSDNLHGRLSELVVARIVERAHNPASVAIPPGLYRRIGSPSTICGARSFADPTLHSRRIVVTQANGGALYAIAPLYVDRSSVHPGRPRAQKSHGLPVDPTFCEVDP